MNWKYDYVAEVEYSENIAKTELQISIRTNYY